MAKKTLKEELAVERKARVVDALRATGGNRTEAARLLGVTRETLHRWLREWGVQRPDAPIPKRPQTRLGG